MSEISPSRRHGGSLLPNTEQRKRLRKLRMLKDRLSRYGVTAAGMAVVGALALIFIYLFTEVAPLLRSSSVTVTGAYASPVSTPADPAEHLVLERYEEIVASFSRSGEVAFFRVDDGQVLSRHSVPSAADAGFSTLAAGQSHEGLVVYGYDNGAIGIVQPEYQLSYPNDQRLITPTLNYPLGEQTWLLDEAEQPLQALAIQNTPAGIQVAAATADGRLLLNIFERRENLFSGTVQIIQQRYTLPSLPGEAQPVHLLVDKSGHHLVVADDRAHLHYYAIDTPAAAHLGMSIPTDRGQTTALKFLVGNSSFVLGTDTGSVSQWFILRNADNHHELLSVRDFNSVPGAVTELTPEYMRKGFLAADDQGHVGLYYATSSNNLGVTRLQQEPVSQLAISPINGRLVALNQQQQLTRADVWNQHPEISFRSLWQEVWYEGRAEPDYIWQSSSASDEFEPKMSLVPLTVGTLKAAFFAMLFALPLGVMGAIYTAYFMTPKLRGVVKPSIEIMEALPTVILGFLAGLWLAPFLESHLPAVFSILLLMPLLMLAVGWSWSRLPEVLRGKVPEGWEAAILVIPILLTGWFCVALSPHVEVWFFDGSMRQWFTNKGITYDQRNALVVGIAMGFAVIPTIFSIAEDAVFNVPRHLTQGSLALGATRWQTVVGVVLPTASPGIFSAIMMGFGRAVGETMIVLMATGNSPVVNFNIFEGMRTLSANIAVELPETAIDSTHFRVLFLAALVLLAMTFIVNTLAESIRQRLRARYSNL